MMASLQNGKKRESEYSSPMDEGMKADIDTTDLGPRRDAASRSPAAERMRQHRERRRLGLRCFTIQLRETEIDELARRGFLNADARNDQHAIRQALYQFLDSTLNPTP